MRRLVSLVLAAFMALLLIAGAGCGDSGEERKGASAADLAERARAEQAQGNFTAATELYGQAREAYLSEGNKAAARECLDQAQLMTIVAMTYSFGESDLRAQLAEAFPDVPEDERMGWIASGELEHMIIDGDPMYFINVIPNIKFRNVDLFLKDAGMLSSYEAMYKMFMEIMDLPEGPPWQPFVNPVTYQGTHTMDIPREILPYSGILKMWFPVPIITGPQPEVRVTAITPDTYVAQPPSIDGDIGVVYMEIPLDELTEDLKLSVVFEFEHYEQRFAIDPAQVGEYDTDDALYRKYTASAGNTLITPEIEKTAREVVGDETNPYLAAKKIYDYVVDNITYSFMPHTALWPRGQAESVYVHENRFGDCGAQSMYFSSLCRALGIPARTTGGWQLFSGNFAGHFWAEFYVPGHGWVPADPTAAGLADYVPGLSEQEVRRFKDFFFANQDHFRCVVQHDVDVPLAPPASQPIEKTVALQGPASNCDTMEEMPDLVLNEYWSISAQVLDR